MPVSRRALRVASSIRQELAMMILRELSDPRLTGMPSITRVKVADDYSIADVYVTVMGTPGQQSAALKALQHSSGKMRARLVKELSMRTTPMLRFHIDEDLKRELELEDLMRKVEQENAELDRRRAAEQGGPVVPENDGTEVPPPAVGGGAGTVGVEPPAPQEGTPPQV